MNVTIVDYNSGNISSVINSFKEVARDKLNIEVTADLNKIKSFIVPPGIGVNYKAGTWHFPLISTEDMNFLIIDRKGSGNNLKIHNFDKDQIVLKY